MAKRDKLIQIAIERGEALDTLIPRLWNELQSDQDVADELGCHKNTISRWRRLNNFRREPAARLVREAEHVAS